MKTARVWIEIIAVGTVIALGLALLIGTLGAAAGTATEESAAAQTSDSIPPAQAADSAPADQQTYEGMVTCSRCGAKHPAAAGKTASDCTRLCVHSGHSFALIDGESSYTLDGNLQLLKKIAGQRARVMGVLRGNTITVASLAPAS